MPSFDHHPPRILQLAFACHPEKGSEPAIGWHRALESAKSFPTWVICNETENREPIERYLAKHGPIPNLEFVFVPPVGKWEQRLWQTPGCYYFAYNLWHRRAFQIAVELHRQIGFDLTHLTTLGGFREPGYLWQLDVPFVWGPVAGAQNYPWRFLPIAGLRAASREIVRSVANTIQMRFSRRVGKAARRATQMLAATTTTAHALSPRRGGPLEVVLDVGTPVRDAPLVRNFRHGGPLRILWSGVFEPRKALHLLLHAVAKLPPEVTYELRILGSGSMEKSWRKLARRLGVDQHCRWLGWQKHEEAVKQFQWADAYAFTSLRDTSGTVVIEALAVGTPVVCLDHQGASDMVTPDCGVKLPVTTPTQVIEGLRDTLAHWHRNRPELEKLSRAAPLRAKQFSWDRHGEAIRAVYRRALNLPEGNEQAPSNCHESVAGRISEPCTIGAPN